MVFQRVCDESVTLNGRVDRPSRLASVLLLVAIAASAGVARAQAVSHAQHALGTVEFPVSCSERAQTEFNRATALLHHMTYPRAREAFQQVATLDPQCAMAHWGIAMTLFQPLWPTRPGRHELRRGWEAVQTARSTGARTDRERLLIDAAAAFFLDPDSTDYWQRIRRWERAMEQAHLAFPNDAEVTAFYALAHLAVAPVDTASRAHGERAAALLLPVFEDNPDHPGAMHYLVHANDAPGRERESLDIVRKYETAAPRNPHALHMPTHIYTRLGDWSAVIRGNLLAGEAALEHPAGDQGQFVWDEFPHAIEYAVYAYLQQGADGQAAEQLKRLRQTERLEPSFKTAFHLASIPARYALERHAWREAASLEPRDPPALDWDRFAWPEAVTWFARGIGSARSGRADGARAAVDRLAELEGAAGQAGEALFARNIHILGLETRAWLAHASRDDTTAVALMREAAELEATTPKHAVTPGPTLPAYELLGDLLLELDRPADALAMYRRSLEHHPGRFNSLLGAARSARKSGDDAAARTFYGELLEVGATGTRGSALNEARDFVARR